MKLLYDLSQENSAALELAKSPEERLMYCVPFNIYEDSFVDGYTAITDKKIYCLIDGKLVNSLELAKCTAFSADVLYGNCAFYAIADGATTLVCRFVYGRNRPRYAVLIKACELLAKRARENEDAGEPLTNSEEERFCPKCGRPFLGGTKICPFCRSQKEVYLKLWGLTRGLRFMLCFPLIVSLFSVAFQFLVPYIQRLAVDKYINPPVDTPSGTITGFILIVVAIVSIDLFQRALSLIQARLQGIAACRFTMMMRTLLYEKVETLSLSSIGKKSIGDLMGRISSDVSVVQSFMTATLPPLFNSVFAFVMAITVLIAIAPLASLFILLPIPLVVFAISKFWKHMRYRNIKNWVLANRVNQLLQDTLNGIRVVKTFGNEEREIKRFRKAQVRASFQMEDDYRVFDTVYPLLTLLTSLGFYIILYYGNILLFNQVWTFGKWQQINSYSSLVYAPLGTFTTITRTFSTFLTSLSKVLEILEEEPEISDIGLPIDISIEGDVEFKNVSFGYESYTPVLENINFSVKKGEMIGVVGHSGSGKTTLINLLMRLYDVLEGEIIVDNVNIKDISQNALRSQIGVVLQETHLFSGSIRDNIRYSKPLASDDEVVAAAKLANAHDFIVNLPDGYNTMIGERGHSLSGGERQRVAIARALIHDPKMLILDEATAALDTETEKLIQDAINKLTKDRTTFAIAHRLSTLRNADRLIVLDRGKLVEIGTHAELLALKGFYWKLVMAQRQDSGVKAAAKKA